MGASREFVTPSPTTRLTHPDPEYPIAPPSPPSVYMSMPVTDRHTQSQTRLQNPVTELSAATAHWRRNAANAHLAAVLAAGFKAAVKKPRRTKEPRRQS